MTNKHTKSVEEIARLFHDTYERLAPEYKYDTRPETRKFYPTSPNGKLMRAVVAEVVIPLLEAERQRCEEMVEAGYENGVKQTIAQFLRMNLENPKAPVNVDEVKRRALSERV